MGLPHRLVLKGGWRKLAMKLDGGFCWDSVGMGWSTRTDVAVNCRDLSCAQLREAVTDVVGCHGPFEGTIYSDGLPGGTEHESGAAAVITRRPVG